MTNESIELLTTREALTRLNISRSTLYDLMRRGVLTPLPSSPALRQPRLRFRREDVERLLNKEQA